MTGGGGGAMVMTAVGGEVMVAEEVAATGAAAGEDVSVHSPYFLFPLHSLSVPHFLFTPPAAIKCASLSLLPPYRHPSLETST